MPLTFFGLPLEAAPDISDGAVGSIVDARLAGRRRVTLPVAGRRAGTVNSGQDDQPGDRLQVGHWCHALTDRRVLI